MKKDRISKLLCILVFAIALLIIQAGCHHDGGGNGTSTTTTVTGGASCVPCGNFDPSCQSCDITQCPTCASLTADGNIMYVYGDGHYAIMEVDENDPDTTTFYDSSGAQCFEYVVYENVAYETTVQTFDNTGQECYLFLSDDTANTITWTVNGEQYVIHAEDGTWDCPDGTTWKAPPGCEEWDFDATVIPQPNIDPEGCDPVTDPCD